MIGVQTGFSFSEKRHQERKEKEMNGERERESDRATNAVRATFACLLLTDLDESTSRYVSLRLISYSLQQSHGSRLDMIRRR